MFKSILLILCLCLVALACCGCQDSLRFAPTEQQKQIAFASHLTARSIEASGTDAHSPAAGQQVSSSAAALSYIGLPKNPAIEDYPTTLAQATDAAVRRPVAEDVFEATEQGLSLAAELAILFGVGGVGFGGKKLLDWLKLASQKSQALKEIIGGNELLKEYLKFNNKENELAAFREFQNQKQSPETEKLVVLERLPVKRKVIVARERKQNKNSQS